MGIDKQIDIAMASHGINRRQISEMGLQVHRIAKMAVVIGVNSIDSVTKVPVENLSYQQLCDIYDRKLINWRELTNKSNGPDLPIIALIRPLDEVDPEVLLEHVDCFSQLPLRKLMQNKQLIVKKKSGEMAKFLAQTPGAIGMTTLVRVAQSNGRIKAVALNNIAPTLDNLLSGAYKLTRDSYLITSAEPSPEVQALLTFIKSTEGEDIIIANNAVPAD